jgi:antitoxin VapB
VNVVTTRTFRSGNSEAVRLPKEIGFGPGTEVEIVRRGNEITIRAKRKSFAEMMENLRKLPKPTTPWVIEPIEFPERGWTEQGKSK